MNSGPNLDQTCVLCHIVIGTETCTHLLDLGDGRVVIPRRVWEDLVEDRLRLRELEATED